MCAEILKRCCKKFLFLSAAFLKKSVLLFKSFGALLYLIALRWKHQVYRCYFSGLSILCGDFLVSEQRVRHLVRVRRGTYEKLARIWKKSYESVEKWEGRSVSAKVILSIFASAKDGEHFSRNWQHIECLEDVKCPSSVSAHRLFDPFVSLFELWWVVRKGCCLAVTEAFKKFFQPACDNDQYTEVGLFLCTNTLRRCSLVSLRMKCGRCPLLANASAVIDVTSFPTQRAKEITLSDSSWIMPSINYWLHPQQLSRWQLY